MLSIPLNQGIESRLTSLSERTGRSPVTLAVEAISEYIGDLEDYYIANQRARANEPLMSLAEVEKRLGLAA